MFLDMDWNTHTKLDWYLAKIMTTLLQVNNAKKGKVFAVKDQLMDFSDSKPDAAKMKTSKQFWGAVFNMDLN